MALTLVMIKLCSDFYLKRKYINFNPIWKNKQVIFPGPQAFCTYFKWFPHGTLKRTELQNARNFENVF